MGPPSPTHTYKFDYAGEMASMFAGSTPHAYFFKHTVCLLLDVSLFPPQWVQRISCSTEQ